jgi:hypothetical protein
VTDPRYDPRFQRGWNGDPEPSAVVPTEPPAPARAEVEAVAASVESEPTAQDDDTWIEQPRYNPFRIALAGVGVALLAIGGWLTWVMVQGQQSTSSPGAPCSASCRIC